MNVCGHRTKRCWPFWTFYLFIAMLMVVFPSAAMAEISFESEPVINGNITVPDETQTTLNIEKPHNSMFNSTVAIPSGTLNAKVSSMGVGVTGCNNVDSTGSSGDYNLWQVEDREFHPYKIWTIKLNEIVDPSSLEAVYVRDPQNQKIEQNVSCSTSAPEILVNAPAGGYGDGIYTLYIEKTLRSARGTALKKAIMMPFTVNTALKGAVGEPSVDFGCLLEEDEEITITEVDSHSVDSGVTIYAYDFNLSSGQPEGAVELILPYDDEGILDDEEVNSVCGKYFNEQTNQWEDVFYFVDAEANEIHIITDHLSTYGVFKITNPTKRSAYISDVNVYAAYMTSAQARNILDTYAAQGPSWKEDVVCSFLEATGTSEYFGAVSASELLTLGGSYNELISAPFKDSVTALSVGTACAQFAFDAYYNGLDSKAASISGMKSVLSMATNLSTSQIQLAYVGVGVIDIALTKVSTFAVDNKYQGTKNMYDAYYKRTENKRDVKYWMKLFENIYKENKANPQKALNMMTAEIERYTGEYWVVAGSDWESWIDAYDQNGNLSKYPWPSEKDRINISNTHKAELYQYLKPLFRTISRNMYLDILAEREKDYKKIADFYNRKFSLEIRENIPPGKKSTWGGCYAGLAPLSPKTDQSSWVGKLNANGGGKMNFTLLAHRIAGFPMQLEIYESAADVKAGNKLKTVTLQPFSDSVQVVTLEPRGEVVTQENPWYEVTIKSSDNDWPYAFRGWCAVLEYPEDSYPDLKNMYGSFNNKGECTLYFQKSDYEGLDSPKHIWLYNNETDLLSKAKPDQVVNFSIASGSYAGDYSGETLYKIIVKAKPPENVHDMLESITGYYSSYMIHSEWLMYHEMVGLMEFIDDYEPGERPSADAWLHYNGPSLTYKSLAEADPYKTELVLNKITDNCYEKEIYNEGTITTYRVDILTIGESAKITLSTVYDYKKDRMKEEYILNKKYEEDDIAK